MQRSERLLVALTDGERQKLSQRLARNTVELGECEEQKAESAKGFNEAIKALREENATIARDVHRGAREELVEVDEIRDLLAGRMTTIRLDTREIVRERRLTPDEAQMTIEDLREQREERAERELRLGEERAAAAGGVTQIIATTPEAQRELDEVAAAAEQTEAGDTPLIGDDGYDDEGVGELVE